MFNLVCFILTVIIIFVVIKTVLCVIEASKLKSLKKKIQTAAFYTNEWFMLQHISKKDPWSKYVDDMQKLGIKALIIIIILFILYCLLPDPHSGLDGFWMDYKVDYWLG